MTAIESIAVKPGNLREMGDSWSYFEELGDSWPVLAGHLTVSGLRL